MVLDPRKMSLYVPAKYADKHIVERLEKIGEKEDRSLNSIACRALLEYVEAYEKPKKTKPSPGGKG